MIRHITAEENVSGGSVIDPEKVRHGIITAMRIQELSGWVDPSTHLNLDFPGHLLQLAVVAESLEPGAKVLEKESRMMHAIVDPSVFRHYGAIDTTTRANDLKEMVRVRRERKDPVLY
ncbi:MAG TPA: hypothetical protein VLY83_02065 [Methanoregula sp.]|nr:hypothetical protein [Methanoregula sp.]